MSLLGQICLPSHRTRKLHLNKHFFIFDMKILIHNEKKSDLYGTCYPQGTFNLAIIDRLGFNVSTGSAIELTDASSTWFTICGSITLLMAEIEREERGKGT